MKEFSIQTMLLRYVGAIFTSLVVIWLSIFVVLSLGFQAGIVLPANYDEQYLRSLQKNLDHELVLSQLPDTISYVHFNKDKKVLATTMSDKQLAEAKLFLTAGTQATQGYFLSLKRSENQYVFHYDLAVRYADENLQAKLPSFMTLLLSSGILVTILVFSSLTVLFSKRINHQLKTILAATDKIRQQDLDFAVNKTEIKELNIILSGLDTLHQSLQTTLKTNWQLEQERRQQVAALIHDIKTPLTVIKGNTELLAMSGLTGKQSGYLEASQKNIQKVDSYVQALTDFVKVEQLELASLESIMIEQFIDEISYDMQSLAHAKNRSLTIHQKISSRQIILVSKDLAKRALLNILDNAFVYSAEDSVPEIILKEQDNALVITCTNEGRVFSAEELEKASQPFYRADSSRGASDHLGLGLYVAQLCATKHQGQLILQNVSSGVKVSLTFPISS
ncbi:sensor histidine kinase [Streptococcus merionis]|uniref:sensor histidine kinase n=1 Tax=Streptococcus merionis TaxID=400065 RepID=UPI0035186F4D